MTWMMPIIFNKFQDIGMPKDLDFISLSCLEWFCIKAENLDMDMNDSYILKMIEGHLNARELDMFAWRFLNDFTSNLIENVLI